MGIVSVAPRQGIATLALLTCTTAVAQQQPASGGDDSSRKATVVIRGSAESARRDDPVSRTVVNRDELVKFGDLSLLDSLKRLPGITISDSKVQLRGLGSGYTQLLVDGERPPAGFSLDTLAPDAVERIEILRSATAEFSTQAIAGTVNVVLRKVANKATGEVKGALGGGPTERSANANLAWSDKHDKRSHNFGAQIYHNDSTPTATTTEREQNASRELIGLRRIIGQNSNTRSGINLNGRVNWVREGADSLTWQGFANLGRYRGGSSIATETIVGNHYPYPEESVHAGGINWSVRNDLNWLINLGEAAKLETKAGLFASRRQLDFDREAYDGPILVLNRDYGTDIREQGLTWTGKYSLGVASNHLIDFGWDGGYSQLQEEEVQRDSAVATGMPFNFENNYDASIRRLALYLQDEWRVGPEWSLYLGMRGERIEVTTESGNISARSSSQVFSPLMQALWKLPGKRQDQLRLAITRTYKAPELSRLVPTRFYASINTPVTPDTVGNPALRPELASGVELSYERNWGQGATISISAGARDIKDVIQNTLRLQDERWISTPENLGRATVRTLELETKFPLNRLLPTMPAIETRLSASRNWSTVNNIPGPDNRLSQQPLWSATVGADYIKGSWGYGASLSVVAGGLIRNSRLESTWTAAKRDLDIYFVYRISPSNRLRFTLRNTLKTDNDSSNLYSDELRTFERQRIVDGHLNWRIQYESKF
ncbi:TonB-dependent receptor plug domain-containing protein [Massilia aurea]|uniref:TonB-dependent receptor plug domain-containing protein n=1 Tax=Massilia aurea TaxID=373040 RepID=UPI00216198B2|nr:TonB-dependent receptor [Massilia aurea]MCS0709963.1 TonB-dependent receptor [Massilia aurea]